MSTAPDWSPDAWVPPPGTPDWAADVVRRVLADIAAGKKFDRSFDPADYFEAPAADLGHPDDWQQAQDAWENEMERWWP